MATSSNHRVRVAALGVALAGRRGVPAPLAVVPQQAQQQQGVQVESTVYPFHNQNFKPGALSSTGVVGRCLHRPRLAGQQPRGVAVAAQRGERRECRRRRPQ